MQAKKIMAIIVAAIIVLVILFLIGTTFDTFSDPAQREMQE